jgi:hypothetical protein
MDTLFSGIISSIVTAALLGLIALGWRRYREWRVKQLGDLMGLIIQHRNIGLHQVPDPRSWVQKAKDFEQEAEIKANKVSISSGLLIHWLGEIPNFPIDTNVEDSNQKHYVNLLTAVIERIRKILERHDR